MKLYKFKSKWVLGLGSLAVSLGSFGIFSATKSFSTTIKKESLKSSLLNTRFHSLKMSYIICDFPDDREPVRAGRNGRCEIEETQPPAKKHKSASEMEKEIEDLQRRVRELWNKTSDLKKEYDEVWGNLHGYGEDLTDSLRKKVGSKS